MSFCSYPLGSFRSRWLPPRNSEVPPLFSLCSFFSFPLLFFPPRLARRLSVNPVHPLFSSRISPCCTVPCLCPPGNTDPRLPFFESFFGALSEQFFESSMFAFGFFFCSRLFFLRPSPFWLGWETFGFPVPHSLVYFPFAFSPAFPPHVVGSFSFPVFLRIFPASQFLGTFFVPHLPSSFFPHF